MTPAHRATLARLWQAAPGPSLDQSASDPAAARYALRLAEQHFAAVRAGNPSDAEIDAAIEFVGEVRAALRLCERAAARAREEERRAFQQAAREMAVAPLQDAPEPPRTAPGADPLPEGSEGVERAVAGRGGAEAACPATLPEKGIRFPWCCTLAAGHAGFHVAHDGNGGEIRRWPVKRGHQTNHEAKEPQ